MGLPAKKRREREQQYGSDKIILSSKPIPKPTRHWQYNYIGHSITGNYPPCVFKCCTKISHDIGQCNVNYGRINELEQCSDDNCYCNDPFPKTMFCHKKFTILDL